MTMSQDARYALRMMRKAPVFSITTVMLMALGIGANATVFAAVNAVLLRPLPYQDAGRLMFVRENGPGETSRGSRVGIPDFGDWRAQSSSFTDLAAYAPVSFNLAHAGAAERAEAQVVSANFARVLGVQPSLGRFFLDEDDRPGGGRVVVISDRLWRRTLGGRTDAIGTVIELNAQPYTIVGVMPESFAAPNAADLWIPMGYFTGPMLQWRANHLLEVVGRLRDGVPAQRAELELNAIAQRGWATDQFMKNGWTLQLTPLRDVMLGPTRPALLMLLAAVIAVMAVVCANVASLLLARAASRRQEIAIRVALGATPHRIAGQLMTESGMLAAIGTVIGVLFAYLAMSGVRALAANQIPHFASLRVDAAVLLYALAMAAGAVILFSAAPVVQLLGGRVGLRGARAGATDPGRRLLSRLVTAEVAVSVVLLILALLLVTSFQRLTRTNPGFSAERVLTFRLTLPQATYATPAQRLAAYEEIRSRLAQLSSVQSIGISSSLPFSPAGERRGNSVFIQTRHADARTGQLRADTDPNTVPTADVRFVDAGFFTTLGVRVIRGALVNAGADASSEPQAVINQTAARRVFGNEDPIGQRIAVGSNPGVWRTVVGVIEDVNNRGLRQPPVEEVYLTHQHFPQSSVAFLVRTRENPRVVEGAISRELSRALPGVPVYDVRTMDERLADSVGVQHVTAAVMRGLALVAFLLAVIGLYGVLAYLVAKRTHEFGVRLALGARQRDVIAMLLAEAMSVVGVGVVVGLVASVAAAEVIKGSLYGVGALEPVVFGAVAAVVVGVGAVAAFVPAWRGSRVDPMIALRSD